MISSIYNSTYVLHKNGSRKGKSKKEIEKEEKAIKRAFKLDKALKLKLKQRIVTALSKDNLTDWEKEFLNNLKKFKKPSVKQLETLNKILIK